MKRIILIFNRLQQQDALAFWLSIALAIIAPLLGDIIAPIYYANYTKQIAMNSAFDIVYELAIIYVAILITRTVIWRIGNYFLIVVERKTMERISNHTASHLLGLSMDFYKDHFVGSLVGKHNKFVRAYERMYDEIFFNLVPSIVVFLCTIPVLLIKIPIVGISMIIIGMLFTVMTLRFSRWIEKCNEELAIIDSKVTGIISDQLSNISTIHSFGKIEEEKSRFGKYNQERSDKRKNAWLRGYIQWSVNDIFQITITISAVLIALYYWKERVFTISELILVMSYMTTLANRLSSIGNIIKNIKQSQSDADEMLDILEIESSITDAPHADNILSGTGDIVFDNIKFSYPNTEKPIFDNFYLKIKKGEKVGIVGSSGSGKSTLINLLMRQMDVTGGNINISNSDIRNISLRNLRHSISLVAQEPSLFHRSIMDNIRYAKPQASFEEVMAAAKKAQAHDFIIKTSEGYKTKVGEKGVKLSGGQRQRIALARAFLADYPIMILDEATSSLDSITEAAIQKAIDEMLHNKSTIICIAHRLSTVAKMDRIIVMNHGKIIEQGNHKELIAKNGAYASLVNAQELQWYKFYRWQRIVSPSILGDFLLYMLYIPCIVNNNE